MVYDLVQSGPQQPGRDQPDSEQPGRDKPWFTLPLPYRYKRPREALIVGAGLAGCNTAYSLATRGWDVTVIDAADKCARGASGNNAAIIKPHVTRQRSANSEFFCRGFASTLDRLNLLKSNGAEVTHQLPGVLQLLDNALSYPEDPLYRRLDRHAASAQAQIPLCSDALFFPTAGWIDSGEYCEALLQHPRIKLRTDFTVTTLKQISETDTGQQSDHPGWQLENTAGERLFSACVVLATGAHLNTLAPLGRLSITPVKGQVTRFTCKAFQSRQTLESDNGDADHQPRLVPACPVTGKHYLVRRHDELLIGASHLRDVVDDAISTTEHDRNIAGIKNLVGKAPLDVQITGGWSAIRASTPDRLPLLGPLPRLEQYRALYPDLHHGRREKFYPRAAYWPGLYVNGGHGSRGMSSATLCAEILADLLQVSYPTAFTRNQCPEAISALCTDRLADLTRLHVARFEIRCLRKYRYNEKQATGKAL